MCTERPGRCLRSGRFRMRMRSGRWVGDGVASLWVWRRWFGICGCGADVPGNVGMAPMFRGFLGVATVTRGFTPGWYVVAPLGLRCAVGIGAGACAGWCVLRRWSRGHHGARTPLARFEGPGSMREPGVVQAGARREISRGSWLLTSRTGAPLERVNSWSRLRVVAATVLSSSKMRWWARTPRGGR